MHRESKIVAITANHLNLMTVVISPIDTTILIDLTDTLKSG